MAPEAGILVVGALHLDVVVDAPHLPATDETVVGRGVAYRFGGKGGNQAVAAARMGARVAMAGAVGPDRFGEQILAALDAAGVDRRGVETVPGASGMSVAIVEESGDYGAVIVAGVNREIDGTAVAIPEGLSILILQNEVPEQVNRAVTARAPDGVTVILNAAPARPVPAALLRRVDVLVVNRGEAAQIAGTEDPRAAAAALRGKGPKAVIVTLGARGLLCAAEGAVTAHPAPAVKVVSTHGAGDAFVGALAAELARGETLAGALGFAQAAAALLVATPPAARDGISRAAVEAFLQGS